MHFAMENEMLHVEIIHMNIFLYEMKHDEHAQTTN